MSKTLKAITDNLLDIGFSKLFAHIQKDNLTSIRAAEKGGFVLEEKQIFENNDIMFLFSKSIKKDPVEI